jgi:hypothetical protein
MYFIRAFQFRQFALAAIFSSTKPSLSHPHLLWPCANPAFTKQCEIPHPKQLILVPFSRDLSLLPEVSVVLRSGKTPGPPAPA